MESARVPIAGQCAAPTSCQSHLHKVCTCRCGMFAGPRLSKGGISVVGIRRVAVGSRLLSPRGGRFGFKGVRSGVVRAQEEEKENQELDKVADKPSESWTSSVQRANVVSRIFMATFVWISLFFGMSVANNEISGGRPGRRGPRK